MSIWTHNMNDFFKFEFDESTRTPAQKTQHGEAIRFTYAKAKKECDEFNKKDPVGKKCLQKIMADEPPAQVTIKCRAYINPVHVAVVEYEEIAGWYAVSHVVFVENAHGC